ncbi:hypothetical protein MHYP_G00263390 [Metynnis hypsauchen]
MIHDQYLKGNLSLTITDADFTKRGWYTCDCDSKDLCDVSLQIEPLKTPVHIKPGESLDLYLDISDPVEVIYNNTDAANRSSGQICTVDGRSTQCKDEYTQRATLTSVLQLRRMTPSDSGVYTVMDSRNEETIHIYPVTVQGDGDDSEAQRQNDKARSRRSVPDDVQPCRDQGAAQSEWTVPVLAVLLAVCAVLVGINVWQRRENQQLRKRLEGNGQVNHVQNGVEMNGLGNPGAEEQQSLAQPSNDHEAV